MTCHGVKHKFRPTPPPELRPGKPKCISTASLFQEEIPPLSGDGIPLRKKVCYNKVKWLLRSHFTMTRGEKLVVCFQNPRCFSQGNSPALNITWIYEEQVALSKSL